MSINVTIDGLDYDVDVTMIDSPSDIDPQTYIALRGLKGDTGSAGANGQDGVDGADGISPIATVSKVGDTATISITDLNGTTTATVSDGTDGIDGADGADGFSPSAYVEKVGDTATITITDKDGTTTASISDGGGGGASAFVAEFGTTTYADVKDAYDDDAILICTVPDSGNTMVLQLVYFDVANEIFFFAFPMDDGWYWTQLSNADGWDDGQFYFASTDVATQLRDGLMSALDYQKLSAIESGAEVNVQSDWSQSDNTKDDFIKNKPTIPTVPTNVSAFTNDAGYLTSFTETDPVFTASPAHGISSGDITYWDGKSDFSGDYDDLTNKPTLFSGDYNDLSNKPTIPTVNNAKLTIQKNGSTVKTFTANASSNVTANITVPTKVSDLTNDSGFITGYTETDPIFTASDAYGISSSDISNWDNAYDGNIDFDTTAVSGDDYNLTTILTALGWLNDVIV